MRHQRQPILVVTPRLIMRLVTEWLEEVSAMDACENTIDYQASHIVERMDQYRKQMNALRIINQRHKD